MNTLNDYIMEYLEYCEYRKRLDKKTLKAYRIDLKQQYNAFSSNIPECLSKDTVDHFITKLHKQYKPKTVKRKIASLKAFFHYLEYKELLEVNSKTCPTPFALMNTKGKKEITKVLIDENIANDQSVNFLAMREDGTCTISYKDMITFVVLLLCFDY